VTGLDELNVGEVGAAMITWERKDRFFGGRRAAGGGRRAVSLIMASFARIFQDINRSKRSLKMTACLWF